MEYKEVVKLIEESEKRVDEVLKAARLQRTEKPQMSKDKLELILDCVKTIIGMIIGGLLIFAFFYLMANGGR